MFLTGAYERTVQLPGTTVRILKGAGPLDGDSSYVGALYMASESRALLECLSLSRVRSSEASVVSRAEIEEILERRLSFKGEAWINQVRDHAQTIAPQMGLQPAHLKLGRDHRCPPGHANDPNGNCPTSSAGQHGCAGENAAERFHEREALFSYSRDVAADPAEDLGSLL
ncbi:MAG TPA: hypothetical protein VE871_15850, partial [Longimicrobium sp.]|nr:hypothetical protein [Longimicrobium sp.]